MIGALVDEFVAFRAHNVVLAVQDDGLLLSFAKKPGTAPDRQSAGVNPHGYLIPWDDVTGLRKSWPMRRHIVETRFGPLKSKSRVYGEIYDAIRANLEKGKQK